MKIEIKEVTNSAREEEVEKQSYDFEGMTHKIIKIIENLEAEIVERKRAEKTLQKAYVNLEARVAERIKELNCLYSISQLIEKENITIEEILQGTVDIIPPSWQYPEMTCAQIRFGDQTYTTDNFQKTKWLQVKEFQVSGNRAGIIEVYYLTEKPEMDEGPFLKEERNLINVIAERLGHTIDRLQTQETLMDNMMLADKYIKSLPGLFYVFDEQRFVKWNHKWETVTGYSAEDLATKYGTDFFMGKDQTLIGERMSKVFREGYADAEAELVSKSGESIPYYFTGVRQEIDGKDHLIGLGIDITAHKQAEQEKLKLESQLQQAQKMEAIGTLAGGIAHDFNNILGAILGYAEMAKDDSQPGSTVASDLEQVLEAGNRAKDLVQQILSFSRQNETDSILLQPVRLLMEAIKMLRPTLPATIEINQDLTSTTGLLLADPTQIHQIVLNLCTNAFHAMEETGGKLDISLKEVTLSSEDLVHQPDVKGGTFIQISICDSGSGIAPDIKSKIFDPYFTTKGKGKGTGMGLSIVHGIVKSYGGYISLYSELGQGTAFHVFLPVIENEDISEIKTVEQVPVGRERILFIDDEAILVEMGKDMLERLGYHVTVRSNSIEALETFKNQPDQFDLIITDQTMPGMTGSDIARIMLQIRSDIPIILCTGYSTIISEEKAKSLGIKEFAFKPLSQKNIAVLIRKVLDNS